MQRLKTRAQFQAVLAGATVARSEHFALHRKLLDKPAPAMTFSACTSGPFSEETGFVAPDAAADLFKGAGLWLGAMTPKRWAKRAVTRNAIKRQIYSISADFSPKRQPAAFVVRLRKDFSRKKYLSASSICLKHDVRAELLALMHVGACQP